MSLRWTAAIAIAAASWVGATRAFADDLTVPRLAVQVRTGERVARTRMTLVIENHSDQWQEAFVDLDLPAGAVVRRMSMDVGTGKNRPRMQGRIADRTRAAEVYQAIVDRAQDPALLEDLGDGRYQLRVFPVPEHDTKTVIIEYEHRMPQRDTTATYAFEPPTLRGSKPQVDSLSLSVDGVSIRRGAWSLDEPLRVALSRDRVDDLDIRYARFRGETYFRVEIIPALDARARNYGGVVLAIDTSRTMLGGYEQALAEAQALEAALGSAMPVRVVRGDHEASVCLDLRCAADAKPAGASDLGALLILATEQAENLPEPVAIVLIGDGRHAMGEDESALIWRAGQLGESRVLHVLAAGASRDRFLSRLARAGGGHMAGDATTLLARMPEPIVTDLEVVSIFGLADGLGPAELAPVERGEPIAVFGRLSTASATLELRGRIGDESFSRDIDLVAPDRARDSAVVRGWMRHAPIELTRDLAGVHVVTADRALIVLETDAEYSQLEVDHQDTAHAPRARVPTIRIGSAHVMGSMDKHIMRRYIRGARNQVKHCYNRALLRDRSAAGSMAVRWVIDESGKSTNVAAEGDIEDPEMSACLVRAHQRIRFPAVRHGGIVRVTYPYMFKPPRRHADGLSVTDEADILLHYVESGTQSQAIAALAEIEAELVGRPPRDLLPYLSHARVRAEFDAKFRRAALDRLDQPNPLPALWAAVAVSVASRAPEDLEDVIGQRAVDIESATAILHDLIEGGHLDAAQRVARAWHNGPMTTGELYRVFAGDGYVRAAMPARWFFVLIRAIDHGDEDAGQLDDLIAVARELGLDRVVGDRILRRCDVATAPCTRWLRADLDDPRLRARLESIHNRRIAVLERGRDSEDEIAELANLLEQLGRAGQARRIRSELSDRTSGQR